MSLQPLQAVKPGHLHELKSLVELDGLGVEQRHSEGRLTLLMLAATHGSAEAVGYLLGAAADVEAVTRNGETALMFAAESRHPHVVRALLQHGAEVNRTDSLGLTALHHALEGIANSRCLGETVEILLNAGAAATARDLRGRLPREIAKRRKWAIRVPLVQWQVTGWYRVGRDRIVRALEQAETRA